MSLEGKLSELSLSDFVEMTALGAKTGRLQVRDADGTVAGQLFFRDGRIVGADCGLFTGERAVYLLLRLRAGTFEFRSNVAAGNLNVTRPTSSLLLEGMRRVDELQRMRRRFPDAARLSSRVGEASGGVEALVVGSLRGRDRTVKEVVSSLTDGGEAEEYEILAACEGLLDRRIMQVTLTTEVNLNAGGGSGTPQSELEG
jgi:hypothetical protein